MLLTGITIVIAAIPEGLLPTVTISLALAVNRMLTEGTCKQAAPVETLLYFSNSSDKTVRLRKIE